MRKPRFKKRTIRCRKGSAELVVYSSECPEDVCFSLHGPRGGFAGNFWFPGQDLADILAELGFAAGETPTDRSISLDIVMMELGQLGQWAKAKSHGEWLLLLIQQLGLVAKAVAKDHLVGTIAELSKMAAIAITMMQIGEVEK